MKKDGYHRLTPFPLSRMATIDVGVIGGRKHHIAGLLEADVSRARQLIRASRRRGEEISFLSWFVKCLADTMADFPEAHGIRTWRRGRVLFSETDISLPLEREVEGELVPLPLIIRDASSKDPGRICREIEEARTRQVKGKKDYVLTERRDALLTGLFFHFPAFLRLIIWRVLLRSPFSVKRNMGTAMVTLTGVPGGSGWILPKSLHNLALALGPVSKKPWVVDGEVVPRDILPLTMLFNHDAIDGAPAARFARKLISRLESGYLLN